MVLLLPQLIIFLKKFVFFLFEFDLKKSQAIELLVQYLPHLKLFSLGHLQSILLLILRFNAKSFALFFTMKQYSPFEQKSFDLNV